MDKCILEKDKSYLVKVDKIEPKRTRPDFQRNGATYYNIMVYGTISGKSIMLEYPSPTQAYTPAAVDPSNLTFLHDSIEIGLAQWFKCLQTSNDKPCVVEPCDPPEEKNRIATEMPRSALPKPTTDTIKPEERMNTPMEVPGSGKPNERLLSMCTAWAKDLKVAEVGRMEYGYKVTEQDIEDVGKWGLKIFNTISEQLNF